MYFIPIKDPEFYQDFFHSNIAAARTNKFLNSQTTKYFVIIEKSYVRIYSHEANIALVFNSTHDIFAIITPLPIILAGIFTNKLFQVKRREKHMLRFYNLVLGLDYCCHCLIWRNENTALNLSFKLSMSIPYKKISGMK
ncbi:hypothetical protein RF11_12692 [Thelohanellus kitauei]|uniref:Uncharacterized protein n=1 Tax=Thelohanellus kitauei TaxID=669202 RepID=A0A0C2IMN9_THEKT|nr:hypothetical protein RF11_12692 [Thelohanellus kitauei]